ncbi:MAG: hypothetical protein A2Z83_03220 [Omnitrophica bacterium GWA2_52_8]|nr:MAG: hypothetical protein A2Z83_03220 [Omnitrophica bacterium GWA2_52_8]
MKDDTNKTKNLADPKSGLKSHSRPKRKRGQHLSTSEREELLLKFEELYLQEINLNKIAEALTIDHKTARAYKQMVIDRWSKKKSRAELEILRNRLIDKATLVEKKAFRINNQSSVAPAVRTHALKVVLNAQERISRLCALDVTPIRIEESGENPYPVEKLPHELLEKLDDVFTTCNRGPKGAHEDEEDNGQ